MLFRLWVQITVVMHMSLIVNTKGFENNELAAYQALIYTVIGNRTALVLSVTIPVTLYSPNPNIGVDIVKTLGRTWANVSYLTNV